MINPSVLDKLEFPKVLAHIARYAVTAPGKEQILHAVPLSAPEEAMLEGAAVSAAKAMLIEKGVPPLEFIPGIDEELSLSRIKGGVLSPKKILEVLKLAVISRQMHGYLKGVGASPLSALEGTLFVNKLLEQHIGRVLDDNGEVKDSASRELASIRKSIIEKQQDLRRIVNRIIKELSESQLSREEYITLREGRIVVPVKAEHKRHIRGFIHSESATGQTVYIEPEATLELNNDIVTLGFAEKREIDRILRELTGKIGEFSMDLQASLHAVSRLDAIFAKAQYSIEIIGAYPSVTPGTQIRLLDARHPLLLHKIGRDKAVPLTYQADAPHCVIITGPNAGGKTVVLKTIGILSAMVSAGMHVPASPDSVFPHFSDILIDIGDQQSIEDDLSTFSSHLTNLKNILANAGERSLVLIDEIGTGTDPAAGAALAMAFLEKLRERNACTFVTTHHGNLKLFAHNLQGFENASMEFDTEGILPTYRFRQGIPGSSYAFEIAARIGFKDDLLQLARGYLSRQENQVENILVELEKKSHQMNEKSRELEIENSRLKGLSALYEQRVKRLEQEKKVLLKKSKEEAESFLQEMNRKAEHLIKDIRTANASQESVKSLRKGLRQLGEEKDKTFALADDTSVVPVEEFTIGRAVKIKGSSVVGDLVDVNREKGTAHILTGTLRVQVRLADLEIAAREDRKAFANQPLTPVTGTAAYRLDIRGKKPEDAELEILRFLDAAYAEGMEQVEVLHGKGTGALKKLVKDILKTYPKLEKHYFAPIQAGGDGITIIEFIKD